MANSAGHARHMVMRKAKILYPGIAMAVLVGGIAYFLGSHYQAPVMLFALLIGMAVSFLAETRRCKPGINFTAKTLLQWGVAFLGFRVTPDDFMALGVNLIVTIPLLIALTVAVGFVACLLLKRSWHFALLTGVSVGVCGASAALAIACVIPRRQVLERNTLFTIICVTALSTIAMVGYPILFAALDFSPLQIGFLLGATIHDVAQVVGAGYSVSQDVGDTATLVKIFRVTMLPIVILLAIMLMPKTENAKRARMPWFVIVFACCALINSIGIVPMAASQTFAGLSQGLLITAIAALGMKSSLKQMTNVSAQHIGVVVIETIALLGMAIAVALWLLPQA